MDHHFHVCLILLDTVCFSSLTKRSASFEGTVNFNGLSLDVEKFPREGVR